MKTRYVPIALSVALVAAAVAVADTSTIAVKNVDEVLRANPPGDKPVQFTPVAQISNLGMLVGPVKKIRLHTHEQEDHIVYVVRGRAKARLDEQTREVGPGDVITLPKRVPHSFEQVGSEPFVILVNATPGWDPLKDTKFLE
jgi:mannose-6-phosphate isomerase-like protein (cupin superfamily)